MPSMTSAPSCTSHHCLTQLCLIPSMISRAASISGKMRELIPMFLKKVLYSSSKYSALSIRATVFCAPSVWASMQQVIFFISSGMTAMNNSACAAPASFRPLIEVGFTLRVMRSTLSATFESLSSLSSINVIFWLSLAKSCAKCVPTAPAPAMIIFMDLLL